MYVIRKECFNMEPVDIAVCSAGFGDWRIWAMGCSSLGTPLTSRTNGTNCKVCHCTAYLWLFFMSTSGGTFLENIPFCG
jgi:hypothetical protein